MTAPPSSNTLKTDSSGPSARRAKIFISYRRKDGAGDAERLYDTLKGYFAEKHLFMDVKSLGVGGIFPKLIEEALASSEVLLAVIGHGWLDATDEQGRRRLDDPADWTRREISAALERGAWVIPVLMHGAQMPAEEDLPGELKPLAHRQAHQIPSGLWDTEVKRLVKLLKRRLFRRRRIALALSALALLALSVTLLCRVAIVAQPISLGTGGVAVPPVMNCPERHELIIETLPGASRGGTLLRHSGETVADVRVDFASAKLSETSVRRLILKREWMGDWNHVAYGTRVGEPGERLNFELACGTSLEISAASGVAVQTPTRLSFSQEKFSSINNRELRMRADKELTARMKPLPSVGGDEGFRGAGCRKVIQYGSIDSEERPGDYNAEVISREGSVFTFGFMEMDKERESRRNFMRIGACETPCVSAAPCAPIKLFTLGTEAEPLKARKLTVRKFKDDESADGWKSEGSEEVFVAESADAQSPLLLRSLALGPDHFQLAAEGAAFVKQNSKTVSPNFAERVKQNAVWASLLLALAALSAVSLVYNLVRL